MTRKTKRPTQSERLLPDELYNPSLHPAWLSRIDPARQRVLQADLALEARGLQPVGKRPPSGVLRAVLVALSEAMTYKDWSNVAEAAVLIQELERRLRSDGK